MASTVAGHAADERHDEVTDPEQPDVAVIAA